MNKKGIALVTMIIFIVILSVLALALMMRSISSGAVANRYAASTQAFWLADAGVQKALWELNQNNCVGFVQCQTSTACVSCGNCGTGNKCLAATLGTNGDFDVVMNNTNTSITSTGSFPNRTTARFQRNIQVNLSQNSPFSYAAFAQGSVSLSNNLNVDSYNSSLGEYGVNGNINSNGSIGSNGTSTGIISLSNNSIVNGNASTGPNGTVSLSNGSQVTGTTTDNNNVALSAVTVPSELTNLASGGTLSVSGETQVLNSGDYQYSSISLSNNATLTVNGTVRLYLTANSALSTANNVTINVSNGAKVTIYCDGIFSAANNVTINNQGKFPSNFVIYSTYTGSNGVSLSNNGALYGVVYAPNTDISVGNNGEVFGSLIGETIWFSNNDNIHYDEVVGTTLGSGSFSSQSWQEI